DNKIGSIDVPVAVGVARGQRRRAAVIREISLPNDEVGPVDIAVAVEVAGKNWGNDDFVGGLRKVKDLGLGERCLVDAELIVDSAAVMIACPAADKDGVARISPWGYHLSLELAVHIKLRPNFVTVAFPRERVMMR